MKIFAFIGVGSFFKRHFERCTMIPKRCRYHFALKIEKKNGKSNLRHTIFHLKVLFSPNEYYCTLISRNIFQRAVNFWLFLIVLFQNQDIYSHLKIFRENTRCSKSKVATSNCHISNPFWLYQHRIRNVYFQSCSHLKFQLLIWVTL